jgi:hypothetical protein
MKKVLFWIYIFTFFSGNLFAATSITLTDITQKVYQRNSDGTKNISLSGSYAGDAPPSIEYKIVVAGTETIIRDWTVLSSATIGDNSWSGTMSAVPQSTYNNARCMFNVRVRDSGTPSTFANGTNSWSVGILYAIHGQSLGDGWTRSTGSPPQHPDCNTVPPDACLFYYDPYNTWEAPANQENSGAITFGNTIIAAEKCPVGILNYSVNAMPLCSEYAYPGQGGVWHGWGSWLLGSGADPESYSANTQLTTALDAITAVGGNVEAVLWIGSESDWEDTTSWYEAGLVGYYNILKSAIRSDIPLLCNTIGRETGAGHSYSNMSGWPKTRNSTIKVCNATQGMRVAAQIIDCGIGTSDIHLNNTGMILQAQRFAQSELRRLGKAAYSGRGPRITGFTKVDATHVDVTIAHRGGTDFTPTSGITGFQIFDDATEETITSAVRQNATTIRLTVSGSLDGTVSLRYMFHNNPTFSGQVADNTAMSLPLEAYSSDYPVGNSWEDGASTPPSTMSPGFQASGGAILR